MNGPLAGINLLPREIPRHGAPYLVWPVSRREFYRGIWVALLIPMTWGVILFGMRVLIMMVAATVAATISHLLLKRILRWRRAGGLVYQHSLVGAMLVAALALPTWPAWVIAGIALLLPFAYALLRGAGRERIHVALAAILLVQYLLVPVLLRNNLLRGTDAILARDRLVFGDIRDQVPAHAADPVFFPGRPWPPSRNLGGNDAVTFPRPALVAADTLNEIANAMPSVPAATQPLSPEVESDIRGILVQAFAFKLPSMDMFFLGVSPNRVGCASLIGILAAGLFLSYRYILRARSAAIFLCVFAAASVLLAFTPNTLRRVGPAALWQVVQAFPGELLCLAEFLLLNSDAAFAAVFVLALPGTEPLTPRGRRYFLFAAGLLAAGLHRLDPVTPAATLGLCMIMPLAPLFDRWLARRSWLSGGKRD